METIEEIRHKLQRAKRFSDMDMGNGYHQIGLVEDSRCIGTFQTYEGLHRFKVLFFGVSSATELADLPGYTSIHDNILVWRRIPGEHEANLDACLFDEKMALWTTSVSCISADPKRIQTIEDARPPQNVKSFLQACQLNATQRMHMHRSSSL